MQAGDEVDSEEDDDSLDQRSDVAQSDSLTVTTSSQSSHPVPEQDVDHTVVDSAESPPQCSEDMVHPDSDSPDADLAPPETVHPDETPLITDPTDTDAPETVIPDSDCPDFDVPGPLAQMICTQPSRQSHGS
ncbi:hypothetical protein NHX12_034174 [Muraenolepis orangiensis]|uniref:Uncharacterized protein n=1 Tax=Muraenolepis orangiensis TaxID=630683 RepID=A0A9Q0DA40_9TELE|nr:hypothetical protein NHX12_034174 [Muraenolepis orangiensis]